MSAPDTSSLRQVALEQAVLYLSYKGNRSTTHQTVIEVAQDFLDWLENTPSPTQARLVFDRPTTQ